MEEVNNEEYQIVKDKIGLDNYDPTGITDLISDKVINDIEKKIIKRGESDG